jgi:hypothetical protein
MSAHFSCRAEGAGGQAGRGEMRTGPREWTRASRSLFTLGVEYLDDVAYIDGILAMTAVHDKG